MSEPIRSTQTTPNGIKVDITKTIKHSGNAWQHVSTLIIIIIIRKLEPADLKILHDAGFKHYPEHIFDLDIDNKGPWHWQFENYRKIKELLQIKL